MNEIFNNHLLQKLYDDRNEVISYKVIKESEEYTKKVAEMEKKLKQILNYVPGDMYQEIEKEIDDFMFDHVLQLAEFWCPKYYKIGFIDGMNVKKEIETELEELVNGWSIK